MYLDIVLFSLRLVDYRRSWWDGMINSRCTPGESEPHVLLYIRSDSSKSSIVWIWTWSYYLATKNYVYASNLPVCTNAFWYIHAEGKSGGCIISCICVDGEAHMLAPKPRSCNAHSCTCIHVHFHMIHQTQNRGVLVAFYLVSNTSSF